MFQLFGFFVLVFLPECFLNVLTLNFRFTEEFKCDNCGCLWGVLEPLLYAPQRSNCWTATNILVDRNASIDNWFLVFLSISTRSSSNSCPWPTTCWKEICLGKFLRPTSQTVAMMIWTNSLHIKKTQKSISVLVPISFSHHVSLSSVVSSLLMCLGGFGAAAIDWKLFHGIVFVKGRYLIKYFFIFLLGFFYPRWSKWILKW